MTEQELFSIIGDVASTNPLAPLKLPPYSPDPGPLHKVQFVIELVGKDLIRHSDANKLTDKRTKAALGAPLIYVMAPGWKRWQLFNPTENEAGYDSLAFAWGFVSPKGDALSSGSAEELLKRVSEIAFSVGRKAVPLRPVEDVDAIASFWKEFVNGFDVGVSCYLDPVVDGIDSSSVLRTAYELGFRLTQSGRVEWRNAAWPQPFLSIDPSGSDAIFDLKKRPSIPGVSLGYSLPRSPDPLAALDRMLTAIDFLAQQVGGTARDEDGELLDDEKRKAMKDIVQGAITSMTSAGAAPGSPEALTLFGE